MVAFATVLFSLVVGVVPVELLVGAGVEAVEVRLDGRPIARLDGEPWSLECDFGDELLPHRLEAIALDASGVEVARAVQWVNVAGPRAALELSTGGTPEKGGEARLSWDSVLGEDPERLSVTFDGEPIQVDGNVVRWPPYDPDRVHVVRAEATFPGGLEASAHATLGAWGTTTASHMTAVPVEWTGSGEPDPAVMNGWFEAAGATLEVVAVEKPLAEIVIVRDRQTQWQMDHLARTEAAPQPPIVTQPPGASASQGFGRDSGFGPPAVATSVRSRLRFEADQRVRLLGTTPHLAGEGGLERRVFPRSDPYGRNDGGLLWLLATREPAKERAGPQPLTDAVAVAGQSAAEGHRRRVVVLFTSGRDEDVSELDPAQVRRYLAALGVPLEVWTASRPESGSSGRSAGSWGDATLIRDAESLRRAQRRLNRRLERQRIVWVRGAFLPQDVSLTAAVRSLALLR